MDLLPLLGLKRESFSVETSSSPSEVARRLKANVQETSWRLFWQMPRHPFHGVVDAERFRLIRTETVRRARLDARPLVIGTLHWTGQLTRIDVVLKPRLMVIVHMAFWYGLLLLALAMMIDEGRRTGKWDEWGGICALLAVVLGVGWIANTLASDSARSDARERLERIFR